MKLINCLALAASGDWFTTEENIQAFRQVNGHVPIIRVGQDMTVLNQKLLSFNTTGKVIGFDRNSSGRILILLKWHPDAAPLRLGFPSLMPNAPRKFWMVIPYNPQHRNQHVAYNNEARSVGVSPAVHRFVTMEDARNHIRNEQRVNRHQNYVILEPVAYVAGATEVSF